jgi:predicted MFS family arabinose efflux permease
MVTFPPRRAAASDQSAGADMLEGFRYAATDPTIRALMLLGALPYLLLVPTWGTLFPIYAKDVFRAGPQGLGILLTAVGVGGTLGGFIANALAKRRRQGLLQTVWILVLVAAVAGIAASPSFAVAVFFAFIGGAAEMAHTASNMAMLQMAAPEALRGRVSSLTMIYPVMISSGGLLAGPLSDLLGVRGASMALAATAGVATLALWFASRHVRELRLK